MSPQMKEEDFIFIVIYSEIREGPIGKTAAQRKEEL